ncbi:MAG: TetR/AcrR family transcriptional regulator [Gammaproteobacteria bacterium]|nr:TetR/AcrR family transcriptional regulator [Gammaproteobacteria bacterium]
MSEWPYDTSFEAFKAKWDLQGETLWRNVFEMHKDKMQIKNVNAAISNLEKIFTATFKLSSTQGFQAMSLRDLSKETGISMGGLYAYIGSKNDLASVIEGVQRDYIDKVVGGLVRDNLEPVDCLRAMIFGEIYMMEIMSSWYYFCFMELKGLPKEQQTFALDVELRGEDIFMGIIRKGINSKKFVCERPDLLASQVIAQLQQWHLKQWKFKLRGVNTEEYAAYVFSTLMTCLGYDSSAVKKS